MEGNIEDKLHVNTVPIIPNDYIVQARVIDIYNKGIYAKIINNGKLHQDILILLHPSSHVGYTDFDNLTIGKGITIELFNVGYHKRIIRGILKGLNPEADG